MRILLAHDGSPSAKVAADLVGGIAWPAGSTVRVISVAEPLMASGSAWPGVAVAYSSEADAALEAFYRDELADTVARLGAPDRTVESALLRGRPATVILDHAAAFGPDLLVLGSRGHGAIASLVLGSVSSEVVDHAPCPVLVARQPTLSRLVLAADGSASAAAAQRVLMDWPIFGPLPILVVSVADVPRPLNSGVAPTMVGSVMDAYSRDLSYAKADHQGVATAAAATLREAGFDATAEVQVGDAAAEVIAAAARFKSDLIVMGSRGRTGLTRLLLGSVARNVVHGSSASILVVREAAPTPD